MNEAHDTAAIRARAQTMACDIMRQMSGIELSLDPVPHTDDDMAGLDVVYGHVTGKHPMHLLFCAKIGFFTRMARNMLGEDPEDEEEAKDYAMEFFNVLCGRFVSEIYEVTRNMRILSPPSYLGWSTIAQTETIENILGTVDKIWLISEENELAVFLWTPVATQA